MTCIEVIMRGVEVAGITAIPIAVFWGQILVGRNEATADLLREFHSPEISRARGVTENWIIANRVKPSRGKGGIEPGEDIWEQFYIIGRFFFRLNMLRTSRLINSGKICGLFSHHFIFWWEVYLEGLSDRSAIKHDINALKEWFDLEVSRHRDWQSRWNTFQTRARELVTPPISPATATQ